MLGRHSNYRRVLQLFALMIPILLINMVSTAFAAPVPVEQNGTHTPHEHEIIVHEHEGVDGVHVHGHGALEHHSHLALNHALTEHRAEIKRQPWIGMVGSIPEGEFMLNLLRPPRTAAGL